ncbi:MAG: hypothetical protein Q9180_008047, partial [Flavoplaca navasiana]
MAGTAGVLDVCWRVGAYLAKVKAATGRIERDLIALSFEVNSLVAVNESIRTLWYVDGEKNLQVLSPDTKRIEELWQDVKLSVFGSREVMARLVLLVEEIIGQDGIAVQGKRDGIRKVLRRQSKDDEIHEIRQQLNSHQNALTLALSALNLCYVRSSQTSNDRNLGLLSRQVEDLGFKLKHELTALRSNVKDDDKAASPTTAAVAKLAAELSLNKHFYIPRAVSSIFTGKTDLLDDLRRSLFDVSSPRAQTHAQKRFIIYGLGGSGKTEFCCKFAQDNRQ